MSRTVLELPFSEPFLVEGINYGSTHNEIQLVDPDNCLARRFLNLLNLSGTPFIGIEYHNYSFFSCPSVTYDPTKHISCLSNSTHQVFATANTTSSSSSWPHANCTLVATVPVPVESGMDVYGHPWLAYTIVLHLTWPWKQAPYCKRNGCNERSNFPSFRDPDVPRRGGNIFLIVMSILIPTGIATYLCYIILKSKGFFSSRGNEATSWSSSSELVTIATGLDGSAVQSLPTIVVGESGRLPNPNHNICSICLSDYQPKETLKTMPTSAVKNISDDSKEITKESDGDGEEDQPSKVELLEYKAGVYDFAALRYAAQYGNFEAIVLLVNKNPTLPLLRDNRGFTPLDIALQNVSIYQKEVVEYLYSVTKDVVNPSPFSGEDGSSTLCELLEANFYAIGIEHLYKQKRVHQQAKALIKQMIAEICKSTTILRFLRDNPNIMKIAIKHGIVEFVSECLKKKKTLYFHKIPVETMIEMAITERKEMIVNFICKTADRHGDKIDLVSRRDGDNNTILHYASKLAPLAQLSLVSGAALQMQREMQWYKGIESIARESDRYTRNKKGDTVQFIFTEAHKELVKEGQDWLKDTSGSCMIVGALIASVAFAAAFTVPGDAIALFSSITSVLMFLAICTSRYAEIDFLKSLIFGLATLFISMVAILAAFGASLLIVVGSRFAQALIQITVFGCCPLALFAWFQLPLFVEMVNLSGTPFIGIEYKNYSFFSCQSETNELAKDISCLSNSTHQVFATANTTSSSSSWPHANCTLIVTVQVPVESGKDVYEHPWFAYTNVLHLTWPWKQAPYCKRNGCNERSNFPSFRDPDVPRRGGNIFLIVMGILIPTAIATYLCYIILKSKGFFSGRGIAATSWSSSSELVSISTGLDGPAVKSLPTIVVRESGRLPNPDNNICSICLSEYQPNETLKTMPACNHCFHVDCIDVWLLLNSTCPICRISPVSEKNAIGTPQG
ncbi:hypothetical protein C5167_027444 [Papaver somniferum]|nr:hypothetical protein C5167_027444 [Papaver somniferum]